MVPTNVTQIGCCVLIIISCVNPSSETQGGEFVEL